MNAQFCIPADLSLSLRTAVIVAGPAPLRELVDGARSVWPELAAETVHDTLNDLLMLGFIRIDKEGRYYKP